MLRRKRRTGPGIPLRGFFLCALLAALLLPIAAPPGARAAFASTDVVLVLDVSGSMEILSEIPQDFPHRDEYQESLAQLIAFVEGGERKRTLREIANGVGSGVKLAQLESDVEEYLQTHNLDLKEQSRLGAARRAVKGYLDLLELSRTNNGTNDRVSLVTFDDALGANLPLNGTFATIRQTLDTLEPLGGTNMGAGLQAALDQLAKAPATGGARQQIILLTDGFSNTGLTNQEILDGPAKVAKSRNIPIYTVGFGLLPQTVDQDFLANLARATGGAYVFATTADALSSTLLAYQGYNSSNVLARFDGTIAAGQSLKAGEMMVPAGSQSLRMSYRASAGAQVEIGLTRPDGRELGKSDPGVSLAKQGDLTLLTMANPPAGKWEVRVSRQDLGKEPATYAITAATEGTTASLPVALVASRIEAPTDYQAYLIIGSAVLGALILFFVFLTFRGFFSREASTAGGCFSGCFTVLLVIVVGVGWGGYWLWNQPLFGP